MATGAAAHHELPVRSMGCYTYWEGLPLDGGEMYARGGRAIGTWPTNDGLTMTYVAWPVAEFAAFRADVEGGFLRTLELAGDLGWRCSPPWPNGRPRSSGSWACSPGPCPWTATSPPATCSGSSASAAWPG
jgi:hypothetical protein